MKLMEKSARSRSQKSDSTIVTISSSSLENSSAPKKPQRVKSGYLFEQKEIDASEEQGPRRKESCDYSEKDSKSVTEQGHTWQDSDDGEDKWCALNDSKPDTAKRRVQRVIRTNSDSDLSEASTIDSSSGLSNKGNSRKGEIRARNRERKARQARREAVKNGKEPEQHHQELDLDLDEDDDLVDTDKDMPLSEVNEQLAMRKKRAEARRSPKKLRGKSPHADSAGRPKSSRRAGKKEEILTVPSVITGDDRSQTKSVSKKRQTNPDKIRRKTKSDTPEILAMAEEIAQLGKPLTRSTSVDKIGKRNPNHDHNLSYSSGFHMLLGDSQKDFMLNTATLRPENDSWSNRDLTLRFQDPLSPLHETRKQSSRRSLSPKPKSGPRRDMLSKSKKPQSDRFLCASTSSDFAPRLSSRRLNVSGDDDDDDDVSPKAGKLDYFVTKEQSKVRKSKKGSARSVDDISRRRKLKS